MTIECEICQFEKARFRLDLHQDCKRESMEDMEVGKKHEYSRILKFSLTYYEEELTAAFILRLTFASL